jgi:hypothetical protein
MKSERRILPLWSVEERSACFTVRDTNVQALACVCFRGRARAATDRNFALPVLHARTKEHIAMPNIFTDPIFPAIKKSKALWATYKSTCDRQPNGPWGTPEYNTWHNEESRVGGEWEKAFQNMLGTQPTTREGALALIDCFLETEREMIGNDCLALLKHLRAYLGVAS